MHAITSDVVLNAANKWACKPKNMSAFDKHEYNRACYIIAKNLNSNESIPKLKNISESLSDFIRGKEYWTTRGGHASTRDMINTGFGLRIFDQEFGPHYDVQRKPQTAY